MADPDKSPASVEPAVSKLPGQPPESRVQHFLRRLARWMLALLIALLVGAALIVFPFYLPSQANLRAAQTDLAQAKQQISARETETGEQIAALETQVASLKTEKNAAQQSLTAAQMRLAVLNALADVTAARLALTTEGFNYSNAEFSLTEAIKSLDALAGFASSEQAKGVKDMQDTAAKALAKLSGSDPKAAVTDLDKLTDSLITLRRKLLAAP